MEKLKKYFNNIKIKDKVSFFSLLAVIFIALLLIIFFGKNVAFKIGVSFNLIMGCIVFLLSAILIGKAFMKALVYISAGLSLLIFLAQSYCLVPIRTVSGDNALKLILVVGFVYLVVDFFDVFIKEISDLFKSLSPIKKDLIWKIIFIIVFYVSIIVGFLFALYQVVSPIVLNLCIYK